MSTPRHQADPIDDAHWTQGDSFRLSVVLLVTVTIAQRFIGLFRNVLFCGLLETSELGRWSLASNFLGWAAPFVVLGLPGAFGRLAEHYRHQGQLRCFLLRTASVCATLLCTAVLLHTVYPSFIARLVFNDPKQTSMAALLGVTLACVVGMNFLTEFLTSVRLTRAVSWMHLTNSLVFTGLGVLFVWLSTEHEQSLLAAYAISCAAAALLGLGYMVRFWQALPGAQQVEPARLFWQRVASLAAWIWCGNTIANLLDVSDQLVLKHFSTFPSDVTDELLGQLYAGRVIPVLMVAVASMVAGSMLPYLIKDAESGRPGDVARRLNTVMKYSAVGFTLIAAVTHLASPLLFTWILRGKYDSGLHLMPLAFVHYTWFSLAVIASKYLICTDRARLGIIPLLISLAVCVTLTMALAPRYGLIGIVTGSATASAVGLAALLGLTRTCGMPWERGVWISAILPLTLALGGGAAVAITAIVVLVSLRADWLFNDRERDQLAAAWHGGREHLRHAGRLAAFRAAPSRIACSVPDPPDRAG